MGEHSRRVKEKLYEAALFLQHQQPISSICEAILIFQATLNGYSEIKNVELTDPINYLNVQREVNPEKNNNDVNLLFLKTEKRFLDIGE